MADRLGEGMGRRGDQRGVCLGKAANPTAAVLHQRAVAPAGLCVSKPLSHLGGTGRAWCQRACPVPCASALSSQHEPRGRSSTLPPQPSVGRSQTPCPRWPCPRSTTLPKPKSPPRGGSRRLAWLETDRNGRVIAFACLVPGTLAVCKLKACVATRARAPPFGGRRWARQVSGRWVALKVGGQVPGPWVRR